jgi:hypothetical protein
MWWLSRVSRAPVGALVRTSAVAVLGVALPGGAAAAAAAWLLPYGPVVRLLLGVLAAAVAVGVAASVVPRVRRDVVLVAGMVRRGLRRRGQAAA